LHKINASLSGQHNWHMFHLTLSPGPNGVNHQTKRYRFTFFSTFFFIAEFCLFCRKGKSSVLTGQPFFVLHMTNKNHYAGNSYLFYGAKIIIPLRILPYTIATSTMSFPPPCDQELIMCTYPPPRCRRRHATAKLPPPQR
jgi:hypothetical protein